MKLRSIMTIGSLFIFCFLSFDVSFSQSGHSISNLSSYQQARENIVDIVRAIRLQEKSGFWEGVILDSVNGVPDGRLVRDRSVDHREKKGQVLEWHTVKEDPYLFFRAVMLKLIEESAEALEFFEEEGLTEKERKDKVLAQLANLVEAAYLAGELLEESQLLQTEKENIVDITRAKRLAEKGGFWEGVILDSVNGEPDGRMVRDRSVEHRLQKGQVLTWHQVNQDPYLFFEAAMLKLVEESEEALEFFEEPGLTEKERKDKVLTQLANLVEAAYLAGELLEKPHPFATREQQIAIFRSA